jgi:starch synthase
VLDAPHLYARAGQSYVGPDGKEWPDNGFALPRLDVRRGDRAGRVADYAPDVVHAHDWQAGLVPALLHYRGAPRPARS